MCFASHLRGKGKSGTTGTYYWTSLGQEGMWKIGEMVGDREGRMDACVAAAGILPKAEIPCLTYSAEQFQEVSVQLVSSGVDLR